MNVKFHIFPEVTYDLCWSYAEPLEKADRIFGLSPAMEIKMASCGGKQP